MRSLAAGVLDPGAGLVRVDTMYKGFNAFVENLLIIRYVSSGPCQNCHMNWTKRPRQWKRPILYESLPSKEFNCDITDQSRHSQAWMKSKCKISRANERLKVVTIEPNNKSNWKQPTKPNEYINCIFYPLWLHFWRRKTVLQFWQLILMWSSQCCLMICIYSLTLYKRDCDRLYQNVHTNPQFGRTVSYYWQSSPTSTSGKSIMQTQKGFLWILL